MLGGGASVHQSPFKNPATAATRGGGGYSNSKNSNPQHFVYQQHPHATHLSLSPMSQPILMHPGMYYSNYGYNYTYPQQPQQQQPQQPQQQPQSRSPKAAATAAAAKSATAAHNPPPLSTAATTAGGDSNGSGGGTGGMVSKIEDMK
mmetsp:Transcript_12147/g.20119  ORF Transcript_12147/g.20119 Transcript_12147/m.20119 type:complete len:147 (+) Transcript_12147:77-517(+)